MSKDSDELAASIEARLVGQAVYIKELTETLAEAHKPALRHVGRGYVVALRQYAKSLKTGRPMLSPVEMFGEDARDSMTDFEAAIEELKK